MVGSSTLPSGSLLGGVHGEQTMGLKWFSSSEMLSLLSGLMDLSGLDRGAVEAALVPNRERQVCLLSEVKFGAENERLFSDDRRMPELELYAATP